MISDQKIFERFPYISLHKVKWPKGGANILINLNNIGTSLLKDETQQISKL